MKGPIFYILEKSTDLMVGTMQVESLGDGTFETTIKWRLEMRDSEDLFNKMMYSIPGHKVIYGRESDEKEYKYADSNN